MHFSNFTLSASPFRPAKKHIYQPTIESTFAKNLTGQGTNGRLSVL
jgi:hypothetical protein